MLNAFLDSIFGFVLNWHPAIAIALVSVVVSAIITVSYKFLTDQREMKRLKEQLAEFQKKMKGLRDNPEKLLAVQREAMAVNMEYMRKSMRPTLFTFLPIILIFGWMSAHFAYEPLGPNSDFTLTAILNNYEENISIVVPEGMQVKKEPASLESREVGFFRKHTEYLATFVLSGEEGKYLVTVQAGGEEIDREVLIFIEGFCAPIAQKYDLEVFWSVELGNPPLRVFGLGWIWAYLIVAIAASQLLRKFLNVY